MEKAGHKCCCTIQNQRNNRNSDLRWKNVIFFSQEDLVDKAHSKSWLPMILLLFVLLDLQFINAHLFTKEKQRRLESLAAFVCQGSRSPN